MRTRSFPEEVLVFLIVLIGGLAMASIFWVPFLGWLAMSLMDGDGFMVLMVLFWGALISLFLFPFAWSAPKMVFDAFREGPMRAFGDFHGQWAFKGQAIRPSEDGNNDLGQMPGGHVRGAQVGYPAKIYVPKGFRGPIWGEDPRLPS